MGLGLQLHPAHMPSSQCQSLKEDNGLPLLSEGPFISILLH